MLTDQQKNEALELLKTVIKCNTVNPPGNETTLARLLQKLLRREGIDSSIDEFAPGRGNLIFRIKGRSAGPALLITGHLDTVPPGIQNWRHDPFGGEIEDGCLYGRGASDMKGSVAAMLYAMILNVRERILPPQDIIFLGTASEEMFCQGAAHFAAHGGMNGVGAALVGEPSGMDVIIAHKGAAWMETVTHGKTAHGSMPHLGQNAIIAMNAFLNALQRQLFTTPPHPTLGLPTYSVNEIQGGVAINVVPDHCKCRIDIRTIPGQTKSDIQAMFDAAIAEAMAQMPEFNGHYEFVCWLPPVGVDADHEIVAAFCEACGYTPTVRGVNFFTDASALIGNKDIPFVIFGPGDDKLAHQPDEHVKLTNYYASIDIYRRFMNTYKI